MISISPSGVLFVADPILGAEAVSEFFERSRAAGILELTKRLPYQHKSPAVAFWQDFASLFLRSCCIFSDTDPFKVPFFKEGAQKVIEGAPLMPGAEHLNVSVLEEIWGELEFEMLAQAGRQSQTVRQFIASAYPQWQDVGRIHFHLAENRKEGAKPFAFLSTYSVRVKGKARLQHRPIGVTLQESIKRNDRAHLEQLIKPIRRASDESEFIAERLRDYSLFAPLYLGPEEAFRYLKDIPACEKAGIVCKVPPWYEKNRPPKARVKVQIGERKVSRVGLMQLLDFNVGVSVNGKTLSQAEWQKLLDADGPLVDLGGKWVEVDQKLVAKILGHWQEALSVAGSGGLSFAEAMRLLSGFQKGGSDQAGESDPKHRGWLEFVAGKSLKELLGQLRAPEGKLHERTEETLQQHLKGSLRHYQLSGLSWLKTISTLGLGGCLADDMGLGKTIQVLSMLLVHKHELGATRPSLLVVPTSLLGNWQAEMKRFAPSLRSKILHSSAGEVPDKSGPPSDLHDYDAIITTYGMALRLPWLRKVDWNLVVADEAQAIKNAKTKQAKAMQELKASTKIAMTGTPVENSLGDLWSLFRFTSPGLLGSERDFKEAVSVLEHAGEDGKPDFSPLRELISPYLLRRKKTDKSVISDLPDKVELTANCYLSKRQASLYQKEVTELAKLLSESENNVSRKGKILRSLMRFKQICNHPSQFLGDDSYLPAHSGKFQKLSEIVETIASRQEKVLVFTQFRELTDILAHFLGECFGREGLVLHGGTSVKRRQGLVDQFQKPAGPPFFVLSLKAGGTGLNLTAANHVIHFDRWWNPAVEDQATDRAFRIGQKQKVMVHKMVSVGTVEEKIDRMIREKKQLADSVIGNKEEFNFTEFSDEALLDMVSLDITKLNLG